MSFEEMENFRRGLQICIEIEGLYLNDLTL